MMKSTNPHFFAIILSDTLSQGKLVILRMFVERFGKYLSDKVFLKVPCGSKWPVELIKNGNTSYFGNGWQQFAECYFISHGSFLVFRFESFETCCLKVIIFDKSASEIDYPFNDKQLHENVGPEITANRVVSNRKQANCSGNSQADRCNLEKSAKAKQASTFKGKANIVKRASTYYKSTYPSFSITMHPTYVNGKHRVNIPVSFAVQYFRKQRGNIILNSVDGETRSVEYASYRTRYESKKTMIRRGWKEFVHDNHLTVGDVCVFELINEKANELRVVINRKGGNANMVVSTGYKKQLTSIDSSKLDTSNPYFKVKLTQNHFDRRCLCLPTSFMDKCKNRRKEKAMLQVEDRVWPVKLLCYPSNRVIRLSLGFSAFLDDNNVQVGDACGFELISSKPFWLKVFVFRDNH